MATRRSTCHSTGATCRRGRAAFHDAYGPLDDDALTRARVLAVSLWGALAEYAHDVGMPWLLTEVLAGPAGLPTIYGSGGLR